MKSDAALIMDYSEIKDLINSIQRLEARHAELTATHAQIIEQSAEVLKKMTAEIERIRQIREEG